MRCRASMAGRVLVAGVLLAAPSGLHAGTLGGNATVPMVQGPAGGSVDLYEWNAWLLKNGETVDGQSNRVGANQGFGLGYYTFNVPGGAYSLMLDQPLFFGRPAVFSGINVPGSGTANLNVQLPTDYSVAFGTKSGPWGTNPWTGFDDSWYQTFVADGTSVTGISFKLAGTNTSSVHVSIHQDTGGAVNTWPQVGVSRTVTNVGANSDQWVRFRSGEIPMTPGQRYALKLRGATGNFSIFRRIEDGQGYLQGQAFSGNGVGQPFDVYAIVFSDNDGTVVPYCVSLHDGGQLHGWWFRYWQEIRAVGTSLAGASLFFAGGPWNDALEFRVYIGGPEGTLVGPKKTGRGGFQSGNSGIVGCSWNPGEAPLTPGQIYYLAVSGNPSQGTGGLNAYRVTRPENAYPDGAAWILGPGGPERQPSIDLLMQVVEYAGDVTPPTLSVNPTSAMRTVARGVNPTPDSFNIANTGAGVLAYAITENSDWLSVSPTDGVSTGESDAIQITYSATSLPIGQHNATITVNASGATGSPQNVNVTLNVTAPQFAPVDNDKDGDVDQNDFGRFQRCVTGSGVEQTAPSCFWARLDGDEDVDQDDFGIFQGCISGPGQPADVLCAE